MVHLELNRKEQTMKKTHTISSALTIFALVFATGCDNSNEISGEQSAIIVSSTSVNLSVESAATSDISEAISDDDRVPIKDALAAVKSDIAELKTKEFPNLDFSSAMNYVNEEVGDVYELKVDDYGAISHGEELLDRLLDGVKREFPSSRFSEDKENYFFEAEKKQAYVNEEDNVVHAKIYDEDNLDKLKDDAFGDVNLIMYSTDLNGQKHGTDDEYLAIYSDFGVIMKHARCKTKDKGEWGDAHLDGVPSAHGFFPGGIIRKL